MSRRPTGESIRIRSEDYWVKIVGMLQQSWALVDEGVGAGLTRTYFVDDRSRVFDVLDFGSVRDAELALERNGFLRYAAGAEVQFLTPPQPPFQTAEHPSGRIYSSGKFWC